MTKRKEVPTQHPDIWKIQIQTENGKWIDPIRGKKFKARRYEHTDSSPKRIKRSFESLAEAKAFRLGASVQEPEVNVIKKEVDEMLFEDLVATWKRDWLPSVNISTQLRYVRYPKHFEFFAKMKVVDIEPAEIDAWIAYVKTPEYLASCHSTRTSYEQEFKALRAILSYYSTRCNRSYRLPFLRDHLKMLKVREKSLMRKDLTVTQVGAFLDELKELCWGTKWEAIYFLAAMQYAIYGRIQEAAALFVEDFDLTHNRLEVKRKIQWLRAKGHENRISTGSKTNGGKIFAPIPELASQVLRQWMLRSGVRAGLLFQIDNEIIEYRQIQHKYDRALKNAKLPFSATHILRHASLVEAYSSSPNILAVQKLAGHSSLAATQKYAKARDEQVIEVQRMMDAKLVSIMR